MYLNDQTKRKYEAYKRIMPKTKKRNSGGYVCLPAWLIAEKVIITHQDSLDYYQKKVVKSQNKGFISFPCFTVGLLVKIQIKNDTEA